MKRTLALASVAALALALAGCSSSAGKDAAAAAYEACADPDAKVQVLEQDGNQVTISVAGENAKAFAGTEDETDAILAGEEIDSEGVSGLGVSFAVIMASDCLVEETGYPGSSDQLTDGEEWDGWRFEEESGAGSEFSMIFTAVK